jgi:putative ABC transport system permease protein
MGRVAIRVIRAELSARPFQAALTALVVAVAVGALLVTVHVRSSLDAPYDRLMRATNGPHVTAVTRSAAEAARIARLPGVAVAEEPRPVVEAPTRLQGLPTRLVLVGLPASGVRVDRPLILSGRGLRGPGELLVEHQLADVEGLRPGSRVVFGSGASRRELRVVGVAATARFGPAGWAAPSDVRALAAPGTPLLQAIEMRLDDPRRADEFAASVARARGEDTLRVFDWQRDRAELTDDTRRFLVIIQATTVLALLAAAFTLATTIGGRVLAQRRQIGLFRAVGMTPAQVTGLLVAHYVALALLAAPAGLLAGALVSPLVLDDAARSLAAQPPGPPGPGLMLIAVAGVVLVVALATALPAWHAGRLAATDVLALGRGATSGRASRIAGLMRRLRLPVVVGLGAKDAFSQRARSVMTVGSLALAVTLVATAMGFEATIDRLERDPAMRAQPFDMRVYGEALPERDVERTLASRPEIAAVATIREVPMTSASTGVEIHTRLVGGENGRFHYAIRDGREARAAGEVTLGRGALDELGVGIGDRIQLRAEGHPVSLRVVGRHVEPDDDGRGAVAPLAGVPDAVAQLDTPYWAVRLRPGADAPAVAAAIQRAGHGTFQVERPIESMRQEAADMRPLVYGMVLLMLTIGFVNLLTTLLLAIRERERDFAILASVGATPRQILSTVVAGGSSLAVPAALVGLPLGAWLYLFMIGVTDPADGPDVGTLPSWWWFPLVIPAALALTGVVSLVAARQATRIRPAPALRAE